MLTDTDRRCHAIASDAMAHARCLNRRTSWGMRLSREFMIRRRANRIIALRAAEQARGAQEVQP